MQQDDESFEIRTRGTVAIRHILSVIVNPPIEKVINSKVIPSLVAFLKLNEQPILQFQSLWVLTNIASGTSEQAKAVIDSGALPIAVDLLSSSDNDVKEQSAWLIGNISGDSVLTRDLTLSFNALPAMLVALNDVENMKLSTIRNITWSISNLCRGKPAPDFEVVKTAIPTLAKLINHADKEVVTDAAWALSYLTEGLNEKIQAVLDAGVGPRLVELLASTNESKMLSPILRVIG